MVNDACIEEILKELNKPGASALWITEDLAAKLTSDDTLASNAGLKPFSTTPTADRRAALLAALNKKPQRALLIVVGRQNAGKTTLMWRLRQSDPDPKVPNYNSTNGLIVGASSLCCG